MHTKAFRLVLHLLVWLVIYALPFIATYGRISLNTLFGQPGGEIHAISTALLIGYAYLNHYWLVTHWYLHRKYIVYAALVIGCVLVVIWLPQAFISFKENGPKIFPSGGMGPRRDEHLMMGVSKLSYNVILFVICTFVSISIRQQRQLLEVQKEKLKAELSFLKAQINPHFLFNTLNSIYALAIRKCDDVPKAIIQLSELMRYILKDSNADTVSLQKELIYIGNYVALQKRRLGDTVKITYAAPEEITNKKIAPLILVSFIENAFKHGVNPSEDSAIYIYITVRDEQLHLSLINNKVIAINRDETMGIGLKNATSRLEHLYPGKHQLTIKDEPVSDKLTGFLIYTHSTFLSNQTKLFCEEKAPDCFGACSNCYGVCAML